MTYYKVNTPYQIRYFQTKREAEAYMHMGLDGIAAKRGYSLIAEQNGSHTYWRVLNSKGKTMTGCLIVKCKGTLPDSPLTQHGRFPAKRYMGLN